VTNDAAMRPRRSVLYMPGSNARALEKGRTLGADALILDIEDSIAPEAKAEARSGIASALAEGGYGPREIAIRVNSLDSDWGTEDLRAVAVMGADAVVLPKVENAETVQTARSILDAAGAPATLGIWCMMETPLGILNAREIAFADPSVRCLAMGTSDLAKDLRCRHTPDRAPFLYALEHCIMVARAAGIAILDGVHLDLSDDEGFRASCVQGRDLGMDGKTLIHPKTIDIANQVFAPLDSEIAWAEKIIAAHGEAAKAGKGLVVVDGKLIENLHVAEAQRLMAMHENIQSREA